MSMFISKIPFEMLLVSEIQNLETTDLADKKNQAQRSWMASKGPHPLAHGTDEKTDPLSYSSTLPPPPARVWEVCFHPH